MRATNAVLRIFSLWATTGCLSWMLQTAQIVLCLVVPVVVAFPLLAPRRQSCSCRGRRQRHRTNDGHLDSIIITKGLTWKLEASKQKANEVRVSGKQKQIPKTWDERWRQRYEELKAFRKAHGHCNVPYQKNGLSKWIGYQRSVFKSGRMSKERKKLLEEVDFVYYRYDERWDRYFEKLQSYKAEHGHCQVPFNDTGLGLWVASQRKRSEELSQERIDLLDKIGFVWSAVDTAWQNNYQELVEFRQLHGHLDFPHTGNRNLAQWMSSQRLHHAAGSLGAKKKALLDDVGFVWEDPNYDRNERHWNKMFRELEQYKECEGHVKVPVNKSSLGAWVRHQRKRYHDDTLLEHREEKLESIGFIWRLRDVQSFGTTKMDRKWMKQYGKLKKIQEERGHINDIRTTDKTFGPWFNRQRFEFRHGKLREDRRVLLEELEFEWEPHKVRRDKSWQGFYEELSTYKKEVGHMDDVCTKAKHLYVWIYRQQQMQQAGRLELKRQELLDKLLGVNWYSGTLSSCYRS